MRILVDSLVYHDGGQVALGLRSENIATLKRSALIAGHTGYLSGVKWDMLHWYSSRGKPPWLRKRPLKRQGFAIWNGIGWVEWLDHMPAKVIPG